MRNFTVATLTATAMLTMTGIAAAQPSTTTPIPPTTVTISPGVPVDSGASERIQIPESVPPGVDAGEAPPLPDAPTEMTFIPTPSSASPTTPAQPSATMPPRPDSDSADRAPRAPRTAQARALPGCADFWNPNMGRWFMVCGRILDKYNDFGGQNGKLGLPTSDEIPNPDGVGKRTSFTNDSSIYWSPNSDAHQIGGAIGAEWAARGWEGSPLGYPITDENTNPDGVGKHNQFQGGSVYWSPSTNAHTIWGAIRDKWASVGWEGSNLGYPVSNEVSGSGTTLAQKFQRGKILWTPAHGAARVTSPILDAIENSGQPIENNAAYHIPLTEQYVPWTGGIAQGFSTGAFVWRDQNFTWGYDRTFQAGSTGSYAAKGATLAQVKQSLMNCFNCIFPVQGAPVAYPQTGDVIELKAATAAPTTVKVVQMDPINPIWTFEAMDGHFDGAGSIVAFRFFVADGRVKLQVKAGVVRDNGKLINWANNQFAEGYWQSFIDRVGLNMCYDWGKCDT